MCICMHYNSFFAFKFPYNGVFLTLYLLLLEIRTLFKYIKKFEAVLNEPCQSCLVESNKEEHPDCLPKPTKETETSPIQSLNRALRETLLAQPTAQQVLVRGMLHV